MFWQLLSAYCVPQIHCLWSVCMNGTGEALRNSVLFQHGGRFRGNWCKVVSTFRLPPAVWGAGSTDVTSGWPLCPKILLNISLPLILRTFHCNTCSSSRRNLNPGKTVTRSPADEFFIFRLLVFSGYWSCIPVGMQGTVCYDTTLSWCFHQYWRCK